MAIIQGLTDSFLREILVGEHDFTTSSGDTFMIALYTSAVSLDHNTTAYSATNEVTGTNYSAGGQALVNVTPVLDAGTAVADFGDVSWTSTDLTGVRGALIYNSTNSNQSVMVLDFGYDRSHEAGTFTVTFPVADRSTGIIRLGS
jgi:hypothetical protein